MLFSCSTRSIDDDQFLVATREGFNYKVNKSQTSAPELQKPSPYDTLVATSDGTIVRIFDVDRFFHQTLDCPHINTVADVSPDFFDNMDIESFGTGCSTGGCGSDINENWLCLVCHKVFCGRYANGHMLLHHAKAGHCVCMSFGDLSIWCHGCDMYIDHDFFPKLHRFFSAMHRLKFTTFPPNRALKSPPMASGTRCVKMEILVTCIMLCCCSGTGDPACVHAGNTLKRPKLTQQMLASACSRCDNKIENWVCLQCNTIFCGRFTDEKHMMHHNLETSHAVCICLEDLSIWCYGCMRYLGELLGLASVSAS